MRDESEEIVEQFTQQTPSFRQFAEVPGGARAVANRVVPNPGDEDRVRQIIVGDVGKNKLGLDAEHKDGDVHFAYPIAVLACSKE